MENQMNLADVLEFDKEQEADKIARKLRQALGKHLRKRGFVVALSGGIDSSVSAALAVRAVGPKKVYGLLLPERDSSAASTRLAQKLVAKLGIDHEVFDIAPALEAIGCYAQRDAAIKRTFPQYGPGWKSKITISGGLKGRYNHFNLVVQSPEGQVTSKRLDLSGYLSIVAATNFKQRIRKTMEYFHGDRLNYAVVGTPNRLEYDQGFFVKNGDGSADIKPIAHLYKTQVYGLARHLGLPEEIVAAQPTTDTYSMVQTQDEFYFALPYDKMDIALWAYNHGVSSQDLGDHLGISSEQAAFIYKDIETKRKTTAVLHWPALLLEPVSGPIPKPQEID